MGSHRLTSERSWRAMGTSCHVLLRGRGSHRAARRAQAQVARLEAMWSRFLPESELTRLNVSGGAPTPVSAETLHLVADAVAWWRATEGRFDPTVLHALMAAGYDRDRALGHGPISDGEPAPGCAGVSVDADGGTVTLPVGVALDLGGIGKGQAADLVADDLAHLPGGLVDLGGDLRVWGTTDDDGGWPIAVDDPRDGTTVALLWLREGAVATSSTLRRRWQDGTLTAHHLIDPRLGTPVRGDLVTVTVVTGSAAAAEVLAKAAIVAGTVPEARRLLEGHGVAGLLVPATGPVAAVGGLAELCWRDVGEVA